MMNTSLPRYFLLLLAISLLISWTAQDTDPWESKMDHSLIEKLQSGIEVEVLLILNQQADLSKARQLKTKAAKGNFVFHQLKRAAKNSQAAILQFLDHQGATAQSFYIINSIRTKGSLALIQALAEREDIAQIIENSAFRLESPVVDNEAVIREVEWGIEMINADDVWAMGYTGQDVVVGGQDTGYDWEHPALKSKYRGWDGNEADHNYNWHDAIHSINPLHGDSIIDPSNNPCGLDSPFPCDDGSHGTHTMGTMVGSDGDNEVGVAPDAKWIACRNMERGWGSPVSYIECFEWLMAPTDLNNDNADPSKAPHVFANSWSCPEIEGCNSSNWSVMETVVNNVKASGVVVVVSAGNSGGQGCGTVSTPAAMFENSFTIGSTRSNDRISGFSSRGPVTVDGSNRLKPNVSAPGSQVRSTTPGNNYATFSGTSMAGPHVVGLVALMISANPALAGQVELIEDLIEQTAVPKTIDDEDCGGISGLEVPNNTYGYGRVDALAAVEAALNLTNTEDLLVESGVDVYPNPFSDAINIEFKELFGKLQFELYTATGQLVNNWAVEANAGEHQSFRMPNLSSGVYFYRIQGEQGRVEGRIVKY